MAEDFHILAAASPYFFGLQGAVTDTIIQSIVFSLNIFFFTESILK